MRRGTFTATVTVTSSNGPTDSQTFTIHVTPAGGAGNEPQGAQAPTNQPPGGEPPTATQTFAANAYVTGDNRVVRLYSHGPSWSAELEAVSAFPVTDIVPASITASFGGTQIRAVGVKKVKGDGPHAVMRLAGIFWKGDLLALFGGLPDGRKMVDVLIGGDVGTRGTFKATVSVVVEKGTLTEREYVRASPNPFNPSTTIAFELAKAGRVTLRVYDVSGRLVSTLAAGDMGAGRQEVRWDATRRNGSRVPSGVYFYVLETPERTVKHDLVVAR
ncbi:MAG: T9SS type A sorting domain-containing protein [Candidatus Eisenbacteria bacterium]|uniref:T9SS type A sorting domain-containing protein n=1 Tax=Eiseniibacteriota bacterium TaxID=2212470 RepID=A0A538SF56_UNCEI|nr:MAG: T9SS type A sorting domain-containing protein [Candidatus Eisenbacteria bacterium]